MFIPIQDPLQSHLIHLTIFLHLLDSVNFSRHSSFVHHNVQIIVPKLDMILVELFNFDVVAFAETWLNPNIASDDIS